MIHQYKLGGYNIVIDVCSGSVHVVDEVAYEIIAMFGAASREDILAAMEAKFADRSDISSEDIAECYAQAERLREAGKLFAPDTFEAIGSACIEGIKDDVQKSVSDEIRPISDIRASSEYREYIAGVVVRRAVEKLWEEVH